MIKPIKDKVVALLINQEREPEKDDLHNYNEMKTLIEANSHKRDSFMAVIFSLK